MKIGIIGSIATPVSLLSKGGTEVFCAALAMGLSKKGHDVFLFASADSKINGRHITLIPSVEESFASIASKFALQNDRSLKQGEADKIIDGMNARSIIKAKEYENTIDIFHDNTCSPLVASVSNLFQKPMITTMHMPINETSHYLFLPPYVSKPSNHYVSVSKYQQSLFPPTISHVYNGINLDDYPFAPETTDDYLMWIGRVDPRTPKGLKEALILANDLNLHFSFLGYPENLSYFESEIKPLVTANISSLEVHNQAEKALFYQKAKAGLFPIQWEEPFGLIFIESMACGTPVIAFARGAVPEIIQDGITGFIVNPSDSDIRGNWVVKKTGMEGMKEAISRLYALSPNEYKQMRSSCRAHVEHNFTLTHMIDQYEAIYNDIIKKNQ